MEISNFCTLHSPPAAPTPAFSGKLFGSFFFLMGRFSVRFCLREWRLTKRVAACELFKAFVVFFFFSLPLGGGGRLSGSLAVPVSAV